jgi:hypothetical protein
MKTELKKREDGNVVLWGYIPDPTAEFSENSVIPEYVSKRWVMLGVYTNEDEAQEKQKEYINL